MPVERSGQGSSIREVGAGKFHQRGRGRKAPSDKVGAERAECRRPISKSRAGEVGQRRRGAQVLILHGVWLKSGPNPYEGQLALWAEDLRAFVNRRPSAELAGTAAPPMANPPEVTPVAISTGATRPADPASALPAHPYAVDHARLADVLASVAAHSGCQHLSDPARLESTALLPASDSGSPLPSYELRRTLESMAVTSHAAASTVYDNAEVSEQGGGRLVRFCVPVLTVHPADVVFLLLPILKGLRSLPEKAAVADDLRFFAELMRYELLLLSKGKIIPLLEPDAGSGVRQFRSRWCLSVNEDNDLETYRLLVRSVPPVCRAFSPEDGPPSFGRASSAAGLGRSEVVRGFLAATSDTLVRRWLDDAAVETECDGAPGSWLRALASRSAQDGLVQGDSEDFSRLCLLTSEWSEAVSHAVVPSRFRTCFRLEPPEDPSNHDQSWILRYFIVDEIDRSLLVPAARVWQEGGGTLRFLSRRYERPRLKFVSDLARAGIAFRPIRNTLARSWAPEYCVLSPEQAYRFLKDAAPVLERIGFVVLLPTIEQQTKKPEVRLRIRSEDHDGGGFLQLNDLLKYDWRVALGDSTIDAEEFRRMVDLKIPIVNVRGKWVELDTDHIKQVTNLLDILGEGGFVSAARAICLSLAGGQEGYESSIAEVEVDDRLRNLLDLVDKSASYEMQETPEGFRGTLRPYQARGFSWLHFLTKHGLGACLADDMGLGKTVQLLALALHYGETVSERRRKPMLVVCPASVVYNWQREAQRFAPSLAVMVHHGADRATGRKLVKEAKKHDLVITTYALASRDARTLTDVEWSGLVLDEAQNIKNPATKQARSIKKLRAGYRVALTGTPVENRLTELWSIMDFLNPGYLGSLRSFRSNYATPIERRGNARRAETLRKVVRPFILRRLKTDPAVIRDLPEKEEIKTYCNLTPEQATLYEAFVQNTLNRVDQAEGMERRGLILAMLTGLKQICNHPAHFLKDQSHLEGRSGKLTRLTEMLDEVISAGDSALIFTQFVEMGELLKKSLEKSLDREVLFLHGGVPARKRAEIVDRFQSFGQSSGSGPIVFVLSLRAGGTGLNLTSASRVFHYDRWWNPAVENQATDRAFRIGQTQNVQVYKFICRGTLEERIDALIDEKKALAEMVIGSGEEWVTELSTDELRRLITLDPEAVVSD